MPFVFDYIAVSKQEEFYGTLIVVSVSGLMLLLYRFCDPHKTALRYYYNDDQSKGCLVKKTAVITSLAVLTSAFLLGVKYVGNCVVKGFTVT